MARCTVDHVDAGELSTKVTDGSHPRHDFNQPPLPMNEKIHAAVLEIAKSAILGALENGDAEATIKQLSNGVHAAWCQAMTEAGASDHLPFSKITL
jgi:hypothetical protein